MCSSDLLLEDGGVQITDDGRGIPVDKHPKTGLSTLETVLTVLHAGGKFGGGGYKVSSGLHGVGSSVVNALSTKMIAEVVREGQLYRVEFATGGIVSPLKKIGKTDRATGTRITFYPDPTIFKETVEFDYKWVENYLRHQAYLTKGVYTSVIDQMAAPEGDMDLALPGHPVSIELDHVREANPRRGLAYDKAKDMHYDIISAFIKSMRGSDPDAALYWLARMIDAGEDPKFIARRILILASEDIGNADPQALLIVSQL